MQTRTLGPFTVSAIGLGAMPMSMTESFPPADGPSATEEGVPDEIKDALLNPYAKHGQG